MFSGYLFVIVFLYIFNAPHAFTAKRSLETVLTLTSNFFDQLKSNYESQAPSPELYESIDNELADYVKKVKQSVNSSRGKRHLNSNSEIGILNGFEKVPGLDLPNAFDVTFFVHSNGTELLWYAATLDTWGISLLQYQVHSFSRVGSFELSNGTRIISHSSESTTILVVQRSIGDALVIRLSNDDSKQMLHRVLTLDIPGASYSIMWQGMKQIYLAVASSSHLTVFKWLGEAFDRIQIDSLGAKKLVPFQTGGSMHLIATNERRTLILRFVLRSSEFVEVQKLIGAKDATAFHMDNGHLAENFLALAGQSSTVIYKQSRHRFVPFQEIAATDEIHSLTNDAAVLLLLIKKGEATIYQYDGWKFVESGVRASGILDLVPVSLRGNQLLALRLDYPERQVIPENQLSPTLDSWSFQRITWRRRKTWTHLREETKTWCQTSLNKTLRVAPAVPEFQGSIRIIQGSMQHLRVGQVNGQNVEKFSKLTERWNRIVAETKQHEKAVNSYISKINPSFKNLHAGTVRVNCTTTCYAKRTNTAVKGIFLERLRKIDDAGQNLDFRSIKVSVAKNLPCPIPALTLRDATVSGLVNGQNFSTFVKDVLMVTGDEELTGSHAFSELRVAKAKVPLDLATNYSRQNIEMKSVKIHELNINSGGILLPLNGSASMLSGSLTVPNAKINDLDMRGNIRGKGATMWNPMIHVTEPLELSAALTLRNIKVVRTLQVKDFTRSTGKTYNELLSNALPLNASRVPVHFKFRNDKVTWKTMTLQNLPYKWVTKKHLNHVIISGSKRATMSSIILGKRAYTNLPTPRLPLRLCAVNAISEDFWESNLVVDDAAAKSIKTINVVDQSQLGQVYLDWATSLDEISWSVKTLTGRMTVKKANIGKIVGVHYQELNESTARWVESGRLKGPVTVKNLQVDNLFATAGFKTSLPLKIANAKAMENIYIGKLNGVDFDKFVNNIVNIDDSVSLANVTFVGGVFANEIYASQTSFSLQDGLALDSLGSKEILGTLESEAIIVPHVLNFPPSNIPVNIVTNGNVSFVNEPNIVFINRRNLTRLYNEVWMNDRGFTVTTEFIQFNNVFFQSDLHLLNSFNTPNLGSWDNIEDRVLSKARSQIINVTSSFSSVTTPNIMGGAKSHLRSNISFLNDLEFNSLKKNDTQAIKNSWSFQELIVTGKMELRGRINNLRLATDVVRYDVEDNVLTGTKLVRDLTARNIDGLGFGNFARNALSRNNDNRTIIVKGWKNFNTVQMQHLRVDGTVMKSKIDNSLLKSSMQSLGGKKIFQGSLTTPEIVTNGTFNDIKLNALTHYQLQKRATIQVIKTPMTLSNNLTILGNVTIEGLYRGVELKNFISTNNHMDSVLKMTSELSNFAEGIDVALENRAVYWDKLELWERNSTALIADPVKNELEKFDGLGYCRVDQSSLYCDDRKVLNLISTASNKTRLLQATILTLSKITLVASVTSDPEGGVFISRYDHSENSFHQIAALRVPGIIAGSFTTTIDCLWISLRLRDDIVILRYELWARNFQEWILPGSGAFLMSSTPTEELLILRSDGIWRLGGLAGPRHIFRASLPGQIDTFSFGPDYYVQLTNSNVTTLLKTRYIGN